MAVGNLLDIIQIWEGVEVRTERGLKQRMIPVLYRSLSRNAPVMLMDRFCDILLLVETDCFDFPLFVNMWLEILHYNNAVLHVARLVFETACIRKPAEVSNKISFFP